MIDVLDVLRRNEIEAIKIVASQKDRKIMFVDWDEETEEYANSEDAPWIRYANDDGDISCQLVIGVRYNVDKRRLEILFTETETTKASDEDWCPMNYADDISYWSVLDAVGERA